MQEETRAVEESDARKENSFVESMSSALPNVSRLHSWTKNADHCSIGEFGVSLWPFRSSGSSLVTILLSKLSRSTIDT